MSFQEALDKSYSIAVPGVDERFPLFPETNYTQLAYIRRAYECAKRVKILEDKNLSLDYRVSLAKESLESEQPKVFDIFAGGLMDDFLGKIP
jgi:hypothetical protein